MKWLYFKTAELVQNSNDQAQNWPSIGVSTGHSTHSSHRVIEMRALHEQMQSRPKLSDDILYEAFAVRSRKYMVSFRIGYEQPLHGGEHA